MGELAGVFGVGNGFEAVTSTRSALAADACDFKIGTADFAPIGDFSFENGGDLLKAQVIDAALLVDDDCDSIKCNGDALKPRLFCFEGARGQADISGAVPCAFHARAGPRGVIGDGYAGIVGHELLGEGADYLLHGGRSVDGDASGEFARGFATLLGVGICGSRVAVRRQCKGERSNCDNTSNTCSRHLLDH